MKKLIFGFIAIALVLLLPILTAALTTEEILDKASHSVYRVMNFTYTDHQAKDVIAASGVAITNKILATTCTLISKDKKMGVVQGDKIYFAVLIDISPKQDVCLLYISDVKLEPAQFNPSANIHKGDNVFIVGFPSYKQDDTNEESYIARAILEKNVSSHGNSRFYAHSLVGVETNGSGVFDDQAKLIGFVSKIKDGDANNHGGHVTVFTPIDWIMKKML